MALNGDLSDLSLPDLFYIFQMRGMTGRLALQADHDDAVLYFQRGKLVHVASSRISQHLGQLLVRMDRLTLEQLGVALALQATTHASQPLGEILVSEGWLSPDDLNLFLTHQAEEVLYRVLAWPSGSFNFAATTTAPLLMPLRELKVEQIILEATRRADEWAAIRAKIPSLDCGVLLNDPSLYGITDNLRLKARIVIASITEGALTLRQVVRATGLDEGEIMRIAYELARREAITITKPPTATVVAAGASALPPPPTPVQRSLLAPRRTTGSLVRAPGS
jgi:uncharacterized protein DUF4388